MLVTSHRAAPSRVVEDGLQVIRQRRPPERPFNAFGLPPGSSHALPAWWELRRTNADVVQAWTAPAALAAAHSGKPSIFVFQGVLHEDDLKNRPRVRSMLTRAARGCDVVTTYSKVAADAFTRLIGIEAIPIEPGIRLDAFTAAPAADRGVADAVDRGAARAIFCAADPDEPRKRVRLLVDAFAEIRNERPDAELWLMSTTDESIRKQPGIRIVDPGADRDELVHLYRSADVTVLPAFREAFGLVVIESLACGTPVIGTSDGGAVPELLSRPDTGWVAEPTKEAMAATLREALEKPENPAACRSRAEDFGIHTCAERYEALYKSLVPNAG